jgi:hypothetical protein
MRPTHNKLFLSDQGKLSQLLLAQPPRQFTLAPEQGRYVFRSVGFWPIASLIEE